MKGDCIISFISTQSAKKTYKAAAELAGLNLTQWLRTRLNIQALREIQRIDRGMELTDEQIVNQFAGTLDAIERKRGK